MYQVLHILSYIIDVYFARFPQDIRGVKLQQSTCRAYYRYNSEEETSRVSIYREPAAK